MDAEDLAKRLGGNPPNAWASAAAMDWWSEAESGEITKLFNKTGYNSSVHHSFANVEYMVGNSKFRTPRLPTQYQPSSLALGAGTWKC